LFANSSTQGTPPVRALFFEFPDEPQLFAVDKQFLIGSDILVTPVVEPSVESVSGVFPGKGSVLWRDWYTHDVVNASADGMTTLSAPISHINVHIRDHSAILLHSQPAYTVEETRQGPYSLLVSQDAQGEAFGTAYLDDGESLPLLPSRTLTFNSEKSVVRVSGNGDYHVEQLLQDITVLGVDSEPQSVLFNGADVSDWEYLAPQKKLVARDLSGDLNGELSLEWK